MKRHQSNRSFKKAIKKDFNRFMKNWCNNEYEVAETVSAMLGLAYKSNCVTAVLLSQRLIGAKSFME